MEWKYLLKEGMAILVSGHRGRGKSALGWYLLELSHDLFGVPCYAANVPEDKHMYFPWFVDPYVLDPDTDLPEHAAILIEEAALVFYAREHGLDLNKWISKILGACYQKGQIIIFLSHHTRKLEVNIILDMDLWVLKQPSYWHVEFERRQVKKIVSKAYDYFEGMLLEDARKTAIVFGGTNYAGVPVDNPIPSFWCEELSKIWEGVSLVDEEEPKSSYKKAGNGYTMENLLEGLTEEQALELFRQKLEPRRTPLTKDEIETADMLLDRAKRTLKQGELTEAFESVEKAYEILGEEEQRLPYLGSERGSLTDEEEAAIVSVMARWTIMEEELGPRSKIHYTVTPTPKPGEELEVLQEEEMKEQSVYVQNGLEVHFTSRAKPRIRAVIARHLEANPADLYDDAEPSPLEEYDEVIYFDLRRRTPKQDFTAAGGRIIPSEFVRDLYTVGTDEDLAIVMDPVHARQIA